MLWISFRLKDSPLSSRVKERRLAADLVHVHGAIAAAARIWLRVILNEVIALQLVERNTHQS